MKRSLFETVLGGVVLVVAALFMYFAYSAADIQTGSGYTLSAEFSKIGGLTTGNDVRISGVKVGSVDKIDLNPESFQARVHLSVQNEVQLPIDTMAKVNSEGLMGGFYMELVPGVEEDYLVGDDTIEFTAAPVDLFDLIGKIAFGSAETTK